MEIFIKYLIVFAVGGTFCSVAELLLIKTTWTPSRILVGFLALGVLLEAFKLYGAIVSVCNAGISTPIIGFGANITKGAIQAVREHGFLGIFSGGLSSVSIGLGAAVVFSYLIAVVFKPKAR